MAGRTEQTKPAGPATDWTVFLAANGKDNPFFGGLDAACLDAYENSIPAGSSCEGPGGDGLCVCGYCVATNAYPIMYKRANCRVSSPGRLYCECANRPVRLNIVL